MTTSESCIGSRRTWIRLRRVMTQTSLDQERSRANIPGAATSTGSAVVALMPALLP